LSILRKGSFYISKRHSLCCFSLIESFKFNLKSKWKKKKNEKAFLERFVKERKIVYFIDIYPYPIPMIKLLFILCSLLYLLKEIFQKLRFSHDE